MPKNIIDYSKGVIYEIVCRDINIPNKYAGSTCNFKGRKRGHKSSCNTETNKSFNCNVYQFIREHGGWDNWQMLQICEYPCENKHELLLAERKHIEQNKCSLNQVIPQRTKHEYFDANRDKFNTLRRENYNNNKVELVIKQKTYREKNIDKLQIYRENSKLKQQEKYICECGSEIRVYETNRHYRSQKHCQFIISQKITIL